MGDTKTDSMPLVFGLSIDEDLSWGAVRVNRNFRAAQFDSYSKKDGDFKYDNLADLRGMQKGVDLSKVICDSLARLKKEQPEVFAKTQAVGISTIGLADQEKRSLTSIARKGWISPSSKGPLVQFEPIIREFFPAARPEIGVQNDATAWCLSEHHWQDPEDRVDSLFLAMFSEGVNGGIVNKGLPVASELHQEMGHIWPPLHPFDELSFDPRKHSGCPAHAFCYEGLASGARIRRQWGTELSALKTRKVLVNNQPRYSVCDIIAHYMAHFCWTGALTVSPERILLAGPVIFPAIVPLVSEIFGLINQGIEFSGRTRAREKKKHPPYLVYEAMGTPGFIRSARLTRNQGILAALEVARLTFHGRLPGL